MSADRAAVEVGFVSRESALRTDIVGGFFRELFLAILDCQQGIGKKLGVSFFSLDGELEGSARSLVLLRLGLSNEVGIHGVHFIEFAINGLLQILCRGVDRSRFNVCGGRATKVLDDDGVIGGVNVLGTRGCTEETSDAQVALGISLGGEGSIAGGSVGLSIESREKVFQSLFVELDYSRVNISV